LSYRSNIAKNDDQNDNKLALIHILW